MTSRRINANDFLPGDIITRDVVILGGGASGTYGAIRLQDEGKSVVVVEEKSRLGGQTETYTDPESGFRAEMGVVAWYTSDTVNKFFARLNVALKKTDVQRAGLANFTTIPVDFRTGRTLTSAYSGNIREGLANFAQQLAKYPYLEYGFDLPYPVPADLLLPFGEFAKKYNLEGAMPLLVIFGNGMGDFLNQPTLYVMKLVSMEAVEAIQQDTFQSNRDGNNREIYEKAEVLLGENVLYNSQLLAMDRSTAKVKLVVQTPSGTKYIEAKKLLSAIPPKLDKLAGFDLDSIERGLVSEFKNTGYYTAIIKNTGIVGAVEYKNRGVDSPYNVPVLPGTYYIQVTKIPGHFSVKYCSPQQLSEEVVKANIIADVERLKIGGTANTTTPEFVVFHSHAPFEMTVSPQAIQDGFYKKLYALQGQKNTYWTGAAFHSQDSSKLWEFTERLLPKIIDEIDHKSTTAKPAL